MLLTYIIINSLYLLGAVLFLSTMLEICFTFIIIQKTNKIVSVPLILSYDELNDNSTPL